MPFNGPDIMTMTPHQVSSAVLSGQRYPVTSTDTRNCTSCNLLRLFWRDADPPAPGGNRILVSCDEVHFWLNGYVNKQKCRIWSEANPQVYVETPLHPEKLTVWCALWAGGILLEKR
ncbi:hypothetical protein TNCV_5071631 [Trichonephila clavipes]|nr:hypothetical protein TNCV_5071631 [Trichonephila clavipes]